MAGVTKGQTKGPELRLFPHSPVVGLLGCGLGQSHLSGNRGEKATFLGRRGMVVASVRRLQTTGMRFCNQDAVLFPGVCAAALRN